MVNPRVEEDYGFGRSYTVRESARIMYYIVEQYGMKYVDEITEKIVIEMDAKTEPERREAEVQAYTEFMKYACPMFKPTRDVRLVRVLLAFVDLQIAQEALLKNHESLKGKETFDSLSLKSYILEGGQVAINCTNCALDRMAFEKKNISRQSDLLGFEEVAYLVLRYLDRVSEELKHDIKDADLTLMVRMACRDNMLRLNRAMNQLLNIYNNIEKEIDG